MKTKVTLCTIAIIIGITGLIICSCNKSSSESVRGKCNVPNPEIKQISLIIGEMTAKDLNVEYYKSTYKSTGCPFEMGRIRVSDDVYEQVSQLLKYSNDKIKSFATVLYFNQNFTTVNQLNISDISAFSIFYMIKKETQMHHRLFIMKDNHFTENKDFNINVRYITVNQLSFQLNELIPKIQNTAYNNKSYIILFKKSDLHQNKNGYGHDEFRHLYYKFKATSS